MGLKQKKFTIEQDDLTKIIDVDASDGRSVPINMNFIDENFLTKDTGYELLGAATEQKRHSIYEYKKKDGTSFLLSMLGTSLQRYVGSEWVDLKMGDVTITIANPGVVTLTAHGLKENSTFRFQTTGALPTGITAGTTYYVIATGLTANAFQFSATQGGAAIETTGTQSGVHSIYRVYTENKEVGYVTYDDELYFSNSADNYTKFEGTNFTEYPDAPKGNILDIFEDRMFVAGVPDEPLSVYYSKTGIPTDFTVGLTDGGILKPLGTDTVTNLRNYYGSLLIFKRDSIWKVTFIYDQVVAAFIPKLEQQSGNYGACSRKAVTWVENDLWFFTGSEVRSIGFTDNVTGVLGVNRSVISDRIKETLKRISISNYSKVAVFYLNRRFYLSVPLTTENENDTIFICHLLHSNSWTKYEGRKKSTVDNFISVDDEIYTTQSIAPFGAVKWDDSLNDQDEAIHAQVFFRRLEDSEFNRFRTYRYLDLNFKDLLAQVKVTLRQEASDLVDVKEKSFVIGNVPFGEVIGENQFGNNMFGGGVGDVIAFSPFTKRRISFLSKNQAFLIGLENNELDETFTICEFALHGIEQPQRLQSSGKIISVS